MGDTARELEGSVMEELSKAAGVSSIAPESRIGHIDSVSLLRLASSLERRFDISIDIVDLLQVESGRDLVAVVEDSLARRLRVDDER
jgi:acyl carrier protein